MPIDADIEAGQPLDAAEAAAPDAMPPEDLCESDADCEEGERCEHVDEGEFSRYICVCDPSPDICDGRDNDCDPITLDGSDEETIRQACDGADEDLCAEGRILCIEGSLVCEDEAESRPEICDGVDNDCDPETVDGAAEEGFGDACDGDDADLCTDGTIDCVDGVLGCTDDAASVAELCDGADNDCDPATADGAEEPTLGSACDGDDADHCEEGMIVCEMGALRCTDDLSAATDLCDGIDNDCDASTPDGSAEPSLGDRCDGMDSDLCAEGMIACRDGALTCTDATGDDLDVCDGMDNDCNPITADGADEMTLGDLCDGTDADFCTEGTVVCAGGGLRCTDMTGDALDRCDGVDNDCNPLTPDGAGEPSLGDACDGTDTDLCAEGMVACDAGRLGCTDATGDSPDVCDGRDNDCNPLTADGSAEATLGDLCDGTDSDFCREGTVVCLGGALGCNDATGDSTDLCDGVDNDCNPMTPDGFAEPTFGDACDGADTDSCNEGSIVCTGSALACTDTTGSTRDVCDGVDNDCDPLTADGSAEATLGDLCDGADTDLCAEGRIECSAGSLGCGDRTGSTVDVCDGVDNDCDPATADGSAEATLGDACDGADTDLCAEGRIACTGGSLACDDRTGSTVDICDGVDNDCDPRTADGSAEATLGDLCDGADTDLCAEGRIECSAGSLGCGDRTGSTVDVCDGVDNDCDPRTADGSAEATLGDACDGADTDLCVEGRIACAGGALACDDRTGSTVDVCDGVDNDCDPRTADGAAEATLGDACDGADTDLCVEGRIACTGGSLACDDRTGSTVDVCDGVDNDCDPRTADGAAEATLGDACDGADTDLCVEGRVACTGGSLACDDRTGSTVDVCDGVDNDCDPRTADGAAEATLGDLCDGADTDLCVEGRVACTAGSLACDDRTGSTVDVCDGVDNDCDPRTVDGSAEATLGDACDGADTDLCEEGRIACSGGTLACDDRTGSTVDICDGVDNDCDTRTADGSAEATLGDLCDGTDTDLCAEGRVECSSGSLGCSDRTGSTLDVCDGVDNDCNPLTADGFEASCTAVAGCPGMCAAGSCDYAHCSTVVIFPDAGDPRVASADLYFWRLGDYVEGTRVTALPSLTSVDMNLLVSPNVLSCDTQDHSLSINGRVVGTFSINAGDTTVSRSFSFPAITGPTYTFRIETVRQVAGGCGSAGFPDGASTLTLRP